MEIWKKMWVGVFFWTQCTYIQGSPEGNKSDYGGKDLWKRWVFYVWSERSREWQMVRTKVVTVMRWYAQDGVNQEESEQNEVDGVKRGADSTGEVLHAVLDLGTMTQLHCAQFTCSQTAAYSTERTAYVPLYSLYTVWVKKIPTPWCYLNFFIFSQTVKTFQLIYLHTYYTSLCTPDYEFLFSYLQVWRSYAILSATTYLVHIICAKCPKRTKTRAFRRLRKSFIALLIVVCGKSL